MPSDRLKKSKVEIINDRITFYDNGNYAFINITGLDEDAIWKIACKLCRSLGGDSYSCNDERYRPDFFGRDGRHPDEIRPSCFAISYQGYRNQISVDTRNGRNVESVLQELRNAVMAITPDYFQQEKKS